MTSAKYTPGPWHCWAYTDCDGDPRADGFIYEVHCFSTHEPTDQHNGHELGSGEEARANARLIAAALEQNEALKWALDEIDALSNRLVQFAYPQGMAMLGREDQWDKYRAARAALSKAGV